MCASGHDNRSLHFAVGGNSAIIGILVIKVNRPRERAIVKFALKWVTTVLAIRSHLIRRRPKWEEAKTSFLKVVCSL